MSAFNMNQEETEPGPTVSSTKSKMPGLMRPIRVWLVDDDDCLRAGLADLLRREKDIECARDFRSADAALSTLASKPGPDVILLDIQMRGQNGLDAIRPIKTLARATRVLMLTTFYDSERHYRALHEGASGFLLKSSDIEDLVEHIRKPELAEQERSSLIWLENRRPGPVTDRRVRALSSGTAESSAVADKQRPWWKFWQR
jgi:DNA-binding NtrC family response regulator